MISKPQIREAGASGDEKIIGLLTLQPAFGEVREFALTRANSGVRLYFRVGTPGVVVRSEKKNFEAIDYFRSRVGELNSFGYRSP